CQAGPGRLSRLIGGQWRGRPAGCRENVQIPDFLEKNRIGRPTMGLKFLPAGRRRGYLPMRGRGKKIIPAFVHMGGNLWIVVHSSRKRQQRAPVLLRLPRLPRRLSRRKTPSSPGA